MERCPLGHRVLVASRAAENGEACFSVYTCDGVGCTFCRTELTGSARAFLEGDLTDTDVYEWIKPTHSRRDASRESVRGDDETLSLFWNGDP